MKNGFRLGVTNKSACKSAKTRSQSRLEHVLEEKLLAEVAQHRIQGPFSRPPIEDLQISPISVVEKSTPGKFRFIHNLSSPVGHSVNDAIPTHLKTVQYCKVSDVVDLLLAKSKKTIFMAKYDIKDAFRIVPIHKEDWQMLGMKHKGAYFVDTVLPMGCGTSCAIFQSLTRAICWMMKKICPEVEIFGYLDDFLLCSPDLTSSKIHMKAFEDLCQQLGVPLAAEKTQGPSQKMVFLGIGIDVSTSSLFFEEKRVLDALKKIRDFVRKRIHKRVEWQSMVGTLSFLSQVVVPGRAFMTRISRKLAGSRRWIQTDSLIREDLDCWHEFLSQNLFRSFRMMDTRIRPSFHLYTDASGSLGFGVIVGREWTFGLWDSTWWSEQNIMLLELYPIWLALHLWQDQFMNNCIMIHTDNKSLTYALEKRCCRLPIADCLLRDISLLCMGKGIILRVAHIAGSDNSLADALSRLQVERFREETKGRVNHEPEHIPEFLGPKHCRTMLTC